MKHLGSCHCGRVRFEAEGEIGTVMACNCSICQRKGSLMWFVPRDAMQLLTPADDLRVYEFNRHAIRHYFCPNCGIHTHGEATSPDGHPMAAINARCLEDVDPASLPVTHFDGRSRP